LTFPRTIHRIDIMRSWELARRQYAELKAEFDQIKRERDEFLSCLRECRPRCKRGGRLSSGSPNSIGSVRSRERGRRSAIRPCR